MHSPLLGALTSLSIQSLLSGFSCMLVSKFKPDEMMKGGPAGTRPLVYYRVDVLAQSHAEALLHWAATPTRWQWGLAEVQLQHTVYAHVTSYLQVACYFKAFVLYFKLFFILFLNKWNYSYTQFSSICFEACRCYLSDKLVLVLV